MSPSDRNEEKNDPFLTTLFFAHSVLNYCTFMGNAIKHKFYPQYFQPPFFYGPPQNPLSLEDQALFDHIYSYMSRHFYRGLPNFLLPGGLINNQTNNMPTSAGSSFLQNLPSTSQNVESPQQPMTFLQNSDPYIRNHNIEESFNTNPWNQNETTNTRNNNPYSNNIKFNIGSSVSKPKSKNCKQKTTCRKTLDKTKIKSGKISKHKSSPSVCNLSLLHSRSVHENTNIVKTINDQQIPVITKNPRLVRKLGFDIKAYAQKATTFVMKIFHNQTLRFKDRVTEKDFIECSSKELTNVVLSCMETYKVNNKVISAYKNFLLSGQIPLQQNTAVCMDSTHPPHLPINNQPGESSSNTHVNGNQETNITAKTTENYVEPATTTKVYSKIQQMFDPGTENTTGGTSADDSLSQGEQQMLDLLFKLIEESDLSNIPTEETEESTTNNNKDFFDFLL